MTKTIGAICSLVVLVALIGFGTLTYFFTFTPDRRLYPIRGIDVSHHQGPIDWQKVARDDVAFAYIKATEGGDHVDTQFAKNVADAKAAGVLVGAYHFFTFCRPGREQAENFLKAIPTGVSMLPPVVDLEFSGNCSYHPDAKELATQIEAFLDVVEKAFGTRVIYYSMPIFEWRYFDTIPQRRLWQRGVTWRPHGDWTIWQYHDHGRVDGISGDVDLNVLAGRRMLGPIVAKKDL